MTLNDLIADALRDLGYTGSLRDMLMSFFRANSAADEHEWLLEQVGTNASLNDLRYAYLRSLGYSGAVNDMYRQALIDGVYFDAPPSVWILATGSWNDAGQWDDSATWID